MVARAVGDFGVVLQNLAAVLERPVGIVADAVGGQVSVIGPAALAPHQIIQALALDHERAFDIIGRGRDVAEVAVDGAHGRGQRGDDAMAVPAEVQVRAPVGVI